MRRIFQVVKQGIRNIFITRRFSNNVDYWKSRAAQYGSRAVYNLSNSNSDLQNVDKIQKDAIFPILLDDLSGDEKVALDFGCGTGRFTGDLAELIGGKAIGVDPVPGLIELVSEKENTDFILLRNDTIPLEAKSVDIIFICLVLGGIRRKKIPVIVDELSRVLRDNGLVILIENTSRKPSGHYWYFRNEKWYIKQLEFCKLGVRGSYFDRDEKITIFTGRKNN